VTPFKCPGQDPRFLRAEDIAELDCPQCGRTVEFWPDEPMRACPGCGRRVANPTNSMKCLQWCGHAAQCLEAIRGKGDGGIGPLREELIARMREAFGPDTQGPSHALTVLELAERIGRRVGANPLVLVPAAILHDIGRASQEEGAAATSHGQEGRRVARPMLAQIALPPAIEREILDLIEHHHDREKMDTRNGAPLFDGDLIVNLGAEHRPRARETMAKDALTEPGRQIGVARFADG